MLYLLVPISFLVGAAAGGYLAWTWRGRREPDPVTRRQKLKLVIGTALATILLIALTGYGVLRLGMKATKMSKASTGEAVDDFRKTHGGAKQQAGMPPPGVYTYLTKGYLKAESKLLGNAHMPLPESIPAVLVAKADCFDLELRLFKENHRSEKFCREGSKGFKIVERWETNEMFGIKNFVRQKSSPHGLLGPDGDPKPGSTWKMSWTVTENTSTMPLPVSRPDIHLTVTYVGLTSLDIGGKKVPAHHLSQSASYTGGVAGKLDREVYYSADSFMMLKLHEKSVAGGLATMKFDREYVLESLTPKQ
ncbi:MAG: hypothetical protein RBU30_02605 [Polyangia bacterium]|jgi:hypothetical protein|nr:hypothetical protein [Polyangia bacterium]